MSPWSHPKGPGRTWPYACAVARYTARETLKGVLTAFSRSRRRSEARTGALGRRPYGTLHVHAWMPTRAHVAACKTPSTWGKVRETQGQSITQWCWKPHPTTPWQSPKDEKEKALQDSRPRCCKLPDHEAREHPPRTNDLAVAQHHVVGLEVPDGATT